MNYQLYEVIGPHKDTKRKRTIKVQAFNPEDAEIKALSEGLSSIQSIGVIHHPKPSERQIEYAKSVGIEIEDTYTDLDVSALLSRYEMKDSIPNQGLIDFATNKGILFSLYIGKTALYQKVFAQLNDIDRVAFFIFCVYRYISDDRHANLDTHPNSKLFYEFANSVVNEERFIKSLNRYDGESIKFFGEFTVNGWTYKGGSVDSIAFKSARTFLVENNLISESAPYRSKNLSKPFKKTTDRNIENANNVTEIYNINPNTVKEGPEKQYFDLPKYEIPAVASILVLLIIFIFIY